MTTTEDLEHDVDAAELRVDALVIELRNQENRRSGLDELIVLTERDIAAAKDDLIKRFQRLRRAQNNLDPGPVA